MDIGLPHFSTAMNYVRCKKLKKKVKKKVYENMKSPGSYTCILGNFSYYHIIKKLCYYFEGFTLEA